MPRPKSFDESAALDAAAELFWTQGYESTSIAHLEKSMGIGRQSIYDTFGDKRSLFLKALRRYAESGEAHCDALLSPDAGLAELREYFARMTGFAAADGERRGCLVTNSILEIGDGDPGVAASCRASRDHALRAFEHCLANAAAAGELSADLDVSAAARMLMAQTYGMIVLAKSGTPVEELRASVEQLLGRLTE